MLIKNSLSIKVLIITTVIAIIPLIFISGMGSYTIIQANTESINKMNDLKANLMEDSSSYLSELGEKIISDKAKDISFQAEIYIKENPNKNLSDLINDSFFRDIVIQRVGDTGYTSLTNIDEMIIAMHISSYAEGIDLNLMSSSIENFDQLLSNVRNGKDDGTFFNWTEENGSIKQKFMFISKIDQRSADGKNLTITASTYIDEFTEPLQEMESLISAQINDLNSRNEHIFNMMVYNFGGAIFVAFIFSFILSFLFSKTITNPLIKLKKLALDVSKGNLNKRVNINSKDEIGVLAQSFNNMVKDIKISKEKIKRSEERLNLAMSVAKYGIWEWYIKTNQVFFDERYYTMAGYEPDEFPYQFEEFQKRVHPDNVNEVMNQAKAYLNGEIDQFEVEFRFKKKNGGWMWIQGNGKIVERDEHGHPVRFIGTHSDITKRKKSEEQLKFAHKQLEHYSHNLEKKVEERTIELKDKTDRLEEINRTLSTTNQKLKITQQELHDINLNLEQKVEERTSKIKALLKQKNDFIDQLSHDLKTPITPLYSLLPLIQKKTEDKTLNEYLDASIKSVERIKNIVEKTLELARLNSSKIKLKKEKLNLLEEVNKITDSMQPLLEKQNVEIHNRIDTDIQITADSVRIEELLANLISNAIKYSKTESKGHVIVDAKKVDDDIEVSISDDGIGLTKDQINHIFDEFYIVDNSRHDYDSHGLGLSICKKIVEKHGGRIWAESNGIGKGTQFYFTLKK